MRRWLNRYNLVVMFVLAVGGAAHAQYLQSGPYEQPRPSTAATCFEQRNATNDGWQSQCIGTSSGQLASATDSRFPPSGGSSSQVLRGNNTWGAVPSAAIAVFWSAKITGNGSSQSTAHGLGAVPRICAPVVVKLPALAGILTLASTLFTPGSHDATSCIFTALSGVDYYVMAVS